MIRMDVDTTRKKLKVHEKFPEIFGNGKADDCLGLRYAKGLLSYLGGVLNGIHRLILLVTAPAELTFQL